MSAPPILEVSGLVKGYDEKAVLRGVGFTLHRGECLAVLGRSGIGKSVLLRLLAGLEQPDEGSIHFEGREIVGLSEAELLPIRRKIAMLFQGGALFDSMNVFDNLAFPIREHRTAAKTDLPERVRELLGKVGLEGIEEKWPAELSGGMRKRVALARALALEPQVLLFDEPTTGLDPMSSASIAKMIFDTQRATGCETVVVTHDLPLARTVTDRIAFLDQGRFRFLGTFAEAERSADPLLGAFLAGREETSDVA
ncbi:MAG TPA: ATP-binding cassette domain-containing protein [Thermoanaerobaculia bacterium]|jgi:phospholipid/cholesterol/gamma-HCH transport system ATP-binding protein